jgi:hypothetical protein
MLFTPRFAMDDVVDESVPMTPDAAVMLWTPSLWMVEVVEKRLFTVPVAAVMLWTPSEAMDAVPTELCPTDSLTTMRELTFALEADRDCEDKVVFTRELRVAVDDRRTLMVPSDAVRPVM